MEESPRVLRRPLLKWDLGVTCKFILYSTLFTTVYYYSFTTCTMPRKSQRSQKAYSKKYYAHNKDKIQQAAGVLQGSRQDHNREAYQVHQKSILHLRKKHYSLLAELDRYEESSDKEKTARAAR